METTHEYSIPERFLWIIYVADRNKTTYQHAEEVPHLIPEVSLNR